MISQRRAPFWNARRADRSGGLAGTFSSKRACFETAPEEMGPPQHEREKAVALQEPPAHPELLSRKALRGATKSLVPRLCLGTRDPRGSAASLARQSLAGTAFPGRAWERARSHSLGSLGCGREPALRSRHFLAASRRVPAGFSVHSPRRICVVIQPFAV